MATAVELGGEVSGSVGLDAHLYGGASYTKVLDLNTIGSGVMHLVQGQPNITRDAAHQAVNAGGT